jgi:thioredoxin reductase (NADPH)
MPIMAAAQADNSSDSTALAGSADVAIVGAGPIGLELAVALKRRGVDYIHFDAKQIGYTISWFAPQTRFFSSSERIAIAGVPLQTVDQSKATGEEYLAYLRSVVLQFDLRVNTYEPVIGIARDGDGFVLTTHPPAGERRWRCRKIVLASGGTDRPRRLNIPGEDLPHVDHYFRGVHQYFGKRLLIVGGKNSAVEAAIRCHNAGASVSLCYRREGCDPKRIKYWLYPELAELLKSNRIAGFFRTEPTRIWPDRATLKGPGDPLDVPADFVLALTGYEQDGMLFRLAGVELTPPCHEPVYDARSMQTNVPGIFVAGTAVGGTQDRFRVFIENCHVHVGRIVANILGESPPPEPKPRTLPGEAADDSESAGLES